MRLISSSQPFAVPYSVHLSDIASLFGSKDRVNPSAGGMTVTSASAGTLDEAYERLHATGPEFGGFLSNHGPMAAEAMVRHGHGDLVGSWLDGCMRGWRSSRAG